MDDGTRRRLAQKYDGERAGAYTERRNTATWQAEQETVAELLAALVAAGAVDSVLDVPVGTGRFLPLYAAHDLPVLGVDVSAAMLAVAREQVADPDRVTLRQGDIFELDAAGFDPSLVVCFRFVNWLPHEEVAAAMAQVTATQPAYVLLRNVVPARAAIGAAGADGWLRRVLRMTRQAAGAAISHLRSAGLRTVLAGIYAQYLDSDAVPFQKHSTAALEAIMHEHGYALAATDRLLPRRPSLRWYLFERAT